MKRKAALIARPKDKTVSNRAKPPLSEYERDFYQWIQHQICFLNKGEFEKLDIANLIEEMESLGRSDKRSLQSQLDRLLMHLLKLEYQPEGQGNSNSWNISILLSKKEIQSLLKDSPSLKNELTKFFPEAYEDARMQASIETRIPITSFPKKCPWELKELLPFLKQK